MLAERCATLTTEFISHQTLNPGGNELELCRRLAALLEERGASGVEVVTTHDKHAYVYGHFGTPTLLVNAHVDTVPVNRGWTRDPFTGSRDGKRLYGLGSADTKGAIAAILVALEEAPPDGVAVLFSGDEEVESTVMAEFLRSDHARGLEAAVVCEPTARRVGVAHRGIGAYQARIGGNGGHSSDADNRPKPVLTMARLAVAADAIGDRYLRTGPSDMRGLCMNVAGISGGVAFNVIPDSATLDLSVRPYPGFDTAAFETELRTAAAGIDPEIEVECSMSRPPFAAQNPERLLRALGLEPGDTTPLQFWTEAALLSEAGIDAVVMGPGDIAQAHAPDEWVSIDDLGWATERFVHLFRNRDASA